MNTDNMKWLLATLLLIYLISQLPPILIGIICILYIWNFYIFLNKEDEDN